ncbi:hypothetical protein DFP72DRAFT_488455 [Ephemerocybe angulata]|uniref:Uncharacterized protein n=1 Tax=Ephemerocybe angulata TaxID=980116 RepID=A0A8H6IE85_9AGAR|nr:hypothetical protein DFP72DRAFT_488455 [Tulosesus angulatus]
MRASSSQFTPTFSNSLLHMLLLPTTIFQETRQKACCTRGFLFSSSSFRRLSNTLQALPTFLDDTAFDGTTTTKSLEADVRLHKLRFLCSLLLGRRELIRRARKTLCSTRKRVALVFLLRWPSYQLDQYHRQPIVGAQVRLELQGHSGESSSPFDLRFEASIFSNPRNAGRMAGETCPMIPTDHRGHTAHHPTITQTS